MTCPKPTPHYIVILASVLSVCLVGSNNFHAFAVSENGNAKELALTLIVSDTNGTEVMRIPLNASQSGNTTNVGSTMDVIIKNQNGENLISAYHVQTGCEMGGPLHGCVLK